MMSLPGFCTGTRLMTAFSMIDGAFLPLWLVHPGTCKLCTLFWPHLHMMAALGYGQLVSTTTIRSQILMDDQLITHWKTTKVCTQNINYVQTKFEMQTGTFCNSTRETKLTVWQNHWQKFTSPFFVVQVTHIEITHAIHQLLTFNVCSLVDPVAYVVAVWVRAVHGDPLPIQHLCPHGVSACATR